METLYNKCYLIALKAHQGQIRKWENIPYINHPLAVANKFKFNKTLRCAALLHDVIEDSNITANDLLLDGIPKNVVDIVIILTRSKEETYFEYIKRVSKNVDATRIKLEDLKNNLESCKSQTLIKRYKKAQAFLTKELNK